MQQASYGHSLKLPNRHPRAVGKHASSNIHSCQFLEEKFRCIRDMHLRDPVLVITQPALEETLFQFSVVIVSINPI